MQLLPLNCVIRALGLISFAVILDGAKHYFYAIFGQMYHCSLIRSSFTMLAADYDFDPELQGIPD